jgi:hypothetical protein
MIEKMGNFTPLIRKPKLNIVKLSLTFLFFLIIIIGLISYTLLQFKPQTTKTPAVETNSIKCSSGYPYGWLIYYQFTNQDECQKCADNRETCLLPKVGTLDKCFDNTGTVCQSLNRCDQQECSVSLPICSIVQIDCVNNPYPTPGRIDSGKTSYNCVCNFPTTIPSPTQTPTPTETPIPTETPTPSPTQPPNETPKLTETHTPTPTLTNTPANTPTPTVTSTNQSFSSPTPTVKVNLPVAGERRLWYLIPGTAILIGLLL